MIFRIMIAVALLSPCAALAQAPYEIPKSHVTAGFASAIARYGKELAEWRDHMAKVEEDKKNKVPKEKAYQPFPPPTGDPEVMESVDANGKPNYKIINDDDQALAAKKAALLASVSKATDAAFNAVYPLGKRPLADIREKDIAQSDGLRFQTIAEAHRGILSTVGIGTKSPSDMMDEVAKGRPAADTQFLQDQTSRRQKIEAIHRAAAQMMSDIEDLTISNVDAYVIAPLPN